MSSNYSELENDFLIGLVRTGGTFITINGFAAKGVVTDNLIENHYRMSTVRITSSLNSLLCSWIEDKSQKLKRFFNRQTQENIFNEQYYMKSLDSVHIISEIYSNDLNIDDIIDLNVKLRCRFINGDIKIDFLFWEVE